MRILILSLGTRGDVEIFALLGGALASRGHAITLAASPFYAPLAVRHGCEFLPVGTGTQAELIAVIRGLGAIGDKKDRVRAYAERWVRPQLASSQPALKGAALASDYFLNNLRSVWQRHGRTIPGAEVTYDPPAEIEKLGLYASQQPAHAASILQLVAMNRSLVDPDHRWGQTYQFTGFWTPPSDPAWTAPPELAAFVEEGSPPVVLTMGSMVMFDPDRLYAELDAALEATHERAVVITSWAGPPTVRGPSPRIRLADEVPYEWLFPRARCVVHHGGCGTVGAVLRAGCPSILLPQISSQVNFGELLARAGLVAGIFDPGVVTSADLAGAIARSASDPALAAACATWRARLLADPGVEAAAAGIEHHAAGLGLG